jgi:hypothetical protein
MKSVVPFFVLAGHLIPKAYFVSAFVMVTPLTQHHHSASVRENASPLLTRRRINLFAVKQERNSRSNTQLYATDWPATAAVAAVSLLRGGVGSVALNLGRENYYLQAVASYGTVTALIMNAVMDFHLPTNFSKRNGKKRSDDKKYLNTISSAATSLCLLSGAFTVIFFNIVGSYTNTALRMSNDQGYLAFRAATHTFSKWGFRCFLTSGASYLVSFLLNLYARITRDEDQVYGKAVLGSCVILALLAGYHIHQVVGMATKYIYTPEFLATLQK